MSTINTVKDKTLLKNLETTDTKRKVSVILNKLSCKF